jgi:hypothetical protein
MRDEKFASLALVSLSAGLVPFSRILDPFIPGFLPPVLISPIEASLGVLASTTLLEYSPMPSFEKKWKERFLLASFMGALVISLLGEPVLGLEDRAMDSLSASVAVLGTYFSPFHLIQD